MHGSKIVWLKVIHILLKDNTCMVRDITQFFLKKIEFWPSSIFQCVVLC